MSELVFYTNPQSRGRIAHWMMEELGQPYETVWLGYGPEMKSAQYRAVNPMGKVPAIRHGAVVVTEAAAICAYLADAFPQAELAPAPTSPERAPYLRWLFFAAGPLEQAVTAKAMGWAVPQGREGMAGFGTYADTLDALETALRPGPFVCGERFTAADVYVGSSLSWGLMFGTIESRPVFVDYVARLSARPALLRAGQINEERIKSQAAG
jgi:glutathione S-transferase